MLSHEKLRATGFYHNYRRQFSLDDFGDKVNMTMWAGDCEPVLINWAFLQQIWQCPLPSESGNSQLVQTKFPVFWQNVQIQCVFPDRDLNFLPFSLFSL